MLRIAILITTLIRFLLAKANVKIKFYSHYLFLRERNFSILLVKRSFYSFVNDLAREKIFSAHDCIMLKNRMFGGYEHFMPISTKYVIGKKSI